MNEIESLAYHLRQDFPNVTPSDDRAWKREPALRVIDCVLSLRRNYDGFVVPRLNRFELKFPQTRSVQALRDQIDDFECPDQFVRETLDYRHPDRARVLSEVVDCVLELAATSSGGSELERLEQWAANSHPNGYKVRRIHGFALAGFQYLRMLFGANTTKPDVHIRRYVSRHVGRTVSDLEALTLLEGASLIAGVRLRDLDTTIWETSARAHSR